MLAEKEFLVNNRDSRSAIGKAGSTHKEIVEFKDCYHELQKEPNKDEIHAKVLQFVLNLLKDRSKVKPFGTLNDKAIRYGSMRKRAANLVDALRKKILVIIIYLIIGYM